MSLRNYQKKITKILKENPHKVAIIEQDRQVGITYTLKEYVKNVGTNNPNMNIIYVGANTRSAMNFVDSSIDQLDRRPVFHFNNGTQLYLTSYSIYQNYLSGRRFDLIILDNIEATRHNSFTNIFNTFLTSSLSLTGSKLILTFNEPLINDTTFLRLLRSADSGNTLYMYVPESLINNNNI